MNRGDVQVDLSAVKNTDKETRPSGRRKMLWIQRSGKVELGCPGRTGPATQAGFPGRGRGTPDI